MEHAVQPFLLGLPRQSARFLPRSTLPPIAPPQVRLQMQGGGSPFTVASGIISKEGFGGLYAGLSAGLLRQATYTTSRLGIFKCAGGELRHS